jgi:hypothetical protein
VLAERFLLYEMARMMGQKSASTPVKAAPPCVDQLGIRSPAPPLLCSAAEMSGIVQKSVAELRWRLFGSLVKALAGLPPVGAALDS